VYARACLRGLLLVFLMEMEEESNMKRVFAVVSLLAIVVPTLAYELAVSEPALLSNGGQIGADPRATVVYDNTTTVTAAYTSPNEFGDEVLPNWVGAPGNVLDTFKWSLFNTSTNATLVSTTQTVRFYDFDGAAPILLFTLNFNPITVNLAPGYYTTITSTGLAALNYTIPTTIQYLLVTVQNSAINPSTITSLGQVLANPPTVGSSGNYFDENVAGVWTGYWFGATGPVSNFYYQIGVVPEPAAILMLAGCIALIRRR